MPLQTPHSVVGPRMLIIPTAFAIVSYGRKAFVCPPKLHVAACICFAFKIKLSLCLPKWFQHYSRSGALRKDFYRRALQNDGCLLVAISSFDCCQSFVVHIHGSATVFLYHQVECCQKIISTYRSIESLMLCGAQY